MLFRSGNLDSWSVPTAGSARKSDHFPAENQSIQTHFLKNIRFHILTVNCLPEVKYHLLSYLKTPSQTLQNNTKKHSFLQWDFSQIMCFIIRVFNHFLNRISKMSSAFLLRDTRHAMHDIFLSAFLQFYTV